MKEMLVPEFVPGFEDPQTRRLKGIVSLLDDYRWGALLEAVEKELSIDYVLKVDSLPNGAMCDDTKLAALARNHVVYHDIMKRLRDLPGELQRKLKEVE